MSTFSIIAHVQAQQRTISVRPHTGEGFNLLVDGAVVRRAKNISQAQAFAVEEVRGDLANRLGRTDQKWGIRVATPCGTFDFGDWSFAPLTGRGGFSRDEPILKIFRKWSHGGDPQSALSGARELLRYCLGAGSAAAAA